MILNTRTDVALSYLQAPTGHFWRWSRRGEVIEFDNGITLCFRDELLAYLNLLIDNGFPKLSSILMVLAACKDDFHTCSLYRSGIKAIAQRMYQELPEHADKAMEFLDRIHAMPREFRGADRRGFLLRTIFIGPYWEGLPFKTKAEVREVWFSLKRGEFDAHLNHAPAEVSPIEIREALRPLIHACDRIGSTEALVHLLRTGMQDAPKPAQTDLPPPPDDRPDDPTLLEELLEDKRTCGIAHLAQQVIAALNIPMQSRGSNDMPIGGVSDITNKGSLDRLLLSELAQDDHALMARLANNEALYLRREEPPLKIERERIVLVDSTLRMWGYPKAFATAVAIACQANHVADMPLRSFSLGGVQAHLADIASKSGILNLMEQLDAHLDCLQALEDCLTAIGRQGKEVILITGAESMQRPEVAKQFSALQARMDVLILLGRDGDMQVHTLRQGHRRLHSTARFDLGDLLFRPPLRRNRPQPQQPSKPQKPLPGQPGNPEEGILPAFVQQLLHPLRMPPVSLRLRRTNTCVLGEHRAVVITEKRQVLYWEGQDRGAIEVMPHFPAFPMEFIELAGEDALIIVGLDVGARKLTVYRFEFVGHRLLEYDMSEAVGQYWCPIFLKGNCLMVNRQEYKEGKFVQVQYSIYTDSGYITQGDPDKHGLSALMPFRQHTESVSDLKPTVNPGYSIFKNSRTIGFTPAGELVIEERRLCANGVNLEFDYSNKTTEQALAAESVGISWERGGNARMRRITWQDGTMAFIDDRGFIHLRSSDTALPEVSIVTLIGGMTSAWTSDGKWFGNPYFHLPRNEGEPDAVDLLRHYIYPIYDRIRRK